MSDEGSPFALRRRARDTLSQAVERVAVYRTLARREVKDGPSIDLPWRRRLWLYRRGFTSRADALFDPDEGNYREYISNVQHELADDATEPWDGLLNNKLSFYLLFGAYDEHLPHLYGLVEDGELRRVSPTLADPPWETGHSTPGADETDTTDEAGRTDGGASPERVDVHAWIDDYLDERDALVLKPVYGQGGRDVLVCRRDETGGYRVNDDPTTDGEFATLVGGLEEYLAWEFAEQAEYADELFPDSANTVRAVTMWDDEADEPFLATAVQRIGTSKSAPVDNWGRGGISAEVSDEGVLGRGARWDDAADEVRWTETHPDTGARIEGTRVPAWPDVRDRVVAMAAEFPHLPRIGWDVLVTGEGTGEFVVLEANAHAAMVELQVFRPFLRDPRIRRFYERHGRG